MNMKRRISMLLAGVMMVGTIGTLGTIPASAAGETNTFTLTVPADTNITAIGWNDIGNIQVSNVSIASDKKISVTIENGATGRTLKKTGDDSKTVGYEVKKGTSESNEAFGDSLEFTADGTQAIGAVVSDFSGAANGTYEDTINFKATLVARTPTEVEYTLIGSNADGKKLTSAALLATAESAGTFEYDSTTYTAYNGFISATAGANWNDAQAFVKLLNDNEVDDCDSWTLLTNKDMAFEWWQSTAAADAQSNTHGIKYGQKSFVGVSFVWSGAESGSSGCTWGCSDAGNKAESGGDAEGVKFNAWGSESKNRSHSIIGFVVLRKTPAPTPVTYDRSGKEALSSANLGTKTDWEYDGTTYEVYNGFIPSSSGSSWNDAMGFINALNSANNGAGYNDHKDWTLFTSEAMANAWYSQFKVVNRGGVNYLWSSVDIDTNGAYSLECPNDWAPTYKLTTDSDVGFVVLRGSPAH